MAVSLAGYVLAYLVMFPAGILLMARLARRGFGEGAQDERVEAGRPERPVEALTGGSRTR